jgi:serine/threonine protein kinase
MFMSPEQAIGDREPDARSDIYALGAVLYFLVTGHTPFADENPMKVLIAHAHEPPPPPSQHNEVPDDVELVIMACLQKSPDDRYQSAAELAAAIEECDDYGEWTRDSARQWWQEHESEYAREHAAEMSPGRRPILRRSALLLTAAEGPSYLRLEFGSRLPRITHGSFAPPRSQPACRGQLVAGVCGRRRANAAFVLVRRGLDSGPARCRCSPTPTQQ